MIINYALGGPKACLGTDRIKSEPGAFATGDQAGQELPWSSHHYLKRQNILIETLYRPGYFNVTVVILLLHKKKKKRVLVLGMEWFFYKNTMVIVDFFFLSY